MVAGLDRLVKCTSAQQHWFWDTAASQEIVTANIRDGRRLQRSRPKQLKVLVVTLDSLLTFERHVDDIVTVAGCSVAVPNKLRVHVVMLSCWLTFECHVDDIVNACNCHLRALRHIRRSLSKDTAQIIAHFRLGSRIDYCNALLNEAPGQTIAKLQ